MSKESDQGQNELEILKALNVELTESFAELQHECDLARLEVIKITEDLNTTLKEKEETSRYSDDRLTDMQYNLNRLEECLRLSQSERIIVEADLDRLTTRMLDLEEKLVFIRRREEADAIRLKKTNAVRTRPWSKKIDRKHKKDAFFGTFSMDNPLGEETNLQSSETGEDKDDHRITSDRTQNSGESDSEAGSSDTGDTSDSSVSVKLTTAEVMKVHRAMLYAQYGASYLNEYDDLHDDAMIAPAGLANETNTESTPAAGADVDKNMLPITERTEREEVCDNVRKEEGRKETAGAQDTPVKLKNLVEIMGGRYLEIPMPENQESEGTGKKDAGILPNISMEEKKQMEQPKLLVNVGKKPKIDNLNHNRKFLARQQWMVAATAAIFGMLGKQILSMRNSRD